jgi:hypothetical protein
MKEQLEIARNYLLPDLLANVGMNKEDVKLETLDQLQCICML